jgi:cation-dependent mannose-6-phosphate receptor
LNTELVLRGPKLILNYTHGSPCESKQKKRDMIKGDHTRRKSTTISLLCDQLSMDSKSPKVKLFFVSSDADECNYYFEARSAAACAGVEATPQQLGPGGVFGVMYAPP